MGRLSLVALALLTLAGCDVLFPEFAGHKQDAGMSPDGASADPDGGAVSAQLTGQICLLGDVRDYRTCSAAHAGNVQITIEETGDHTLSAADGSFVLEPKAPLSVATLVAVDPSGQLATTVSQLRPTSSTTALALPMITSATVSTLAIDNGFAVDPTRGALILWAVTSGGIPIDGVSAGHTSVGNGPFYDGAEVGQMQSAAATGPRGMVALFNLPAGAATLALAPPPPHAANQFTLPVRAGAITMTTLAFP